MPEPAPISESRRRFLERVLAAAVVTTVAPSVVLATLRPSFRSVGGRLMGLYRIDLALPQFAALRTVNGSLKLVNVAGQKNLNIIVTRTSVQTFAAVEAFCTHDPCDLPVPNAAGEIVCPCHGAKFAPDGRLTKGPARYNLPTYNTTFDGANALDIDLVDVAAAPVLASGLVVARNAAIRADGSVAVVRVESDRDVELSATVFDVRGLPVVEPRVARFGPGSHHLVVPVEGLAAGAYFVRVEEHGDAIAVVRLVIP